ncbi:MAG TPA: hypothetical protein VGX48_24915 [Pyrinomonadaceae bacterium]|jgi:pyruvate/2-oxoglutarate dehydrogenase complex dihydrolipoamide acyltransferase (E2) component|nr:hypothetical protein [Pyrinomonadaceae bacterium]
MTGRIVGAVVALLGVGLLALVLNGGEPGPSAVYSRGEGSLLILGTCLCLGGCFYAVKGAGKSAADTPASTQALATRPAARRVLGPARGNPAEAVTMAGAVLISLALGGVIGLWITSWRPSSASAVAPPAEPSKEAPAATASAPPAEESPAAHAEPTAAEPSGDAAVRKRDERPEPSAVREDNPPSRKGQGRADAEEAAPKSSARPSGRLLPCTLAAIPGALTIRGGGAAVVTLRLDETAGPARVGASTPHWADIAVFAEQPAGGGRARYTVRSVSRRPGLYGVTFRTACGSRTVAVTVTGP